MMIKDEQCSKSGKWETSEKNIEITTEQPQFVFPPDSWHSWSCNNEVRLYFKQQMNLTLWNFEGEEFCKYSKLSLKFPLTSDVDPAPSPTQS